MRHIAGGLAVPGDHFLRGRRVRKPHGRGQPLHGAALLIYRYERRQFRICRHEQAVDGRHRFEVLDVGPEVHHAANTSLSNIVGQGHHRRVVDRIPLEPGQDHLAGHLLERFSKGRAGRQAGKRSDQPCANECCKSGHFCTFGARAIAIGMRGRPDPPFSAAKPIVSCRRGKAEIAIGRARSGSRPRGRLRLMRLQSQPAGIPPGRARAWCGRSESNRHSFRNRILRGPKCPILCVSGGIRFPDNRL